MEHALAVLRQRLPFEIVAEIEGYAHDLRPVMAELLETRPRLPPQMVISTKSFLHLKHLRRRYKNQMHSISYETEDKRTRIVCQVGSRPAKRGKTRHYRYFRQPRWDQRRQAWRELGVLL